VSRVALVVTVLNEGASIGALLDSIAGQTRAPDELVVVDGGSSDDTLARVRAWAAGRPWLPTRIAIEPGASIARGRNLAIALAGAEIVAVTDAGVRLAPEWLERLVAPFEAPEPPDVVCGFFIPDPRSTFELALGAVTLPDAGEIRPARFLPSSRSVAFTRAAWRRAGGYPEWLDYCEDLVLDFNLRASGARFAWAPRATVFFRPRRSPRAFWLQYYRYARGDGKADLWRRRHAIRYATYLAAPLLARLLPRRVGLPLLLAGGLAYLWRPHRRLLARRPRSLVALLAAAALLPPLRALGDLAKMAGYPVGLAWRFRRRPPTWRLPPRCEGGR